MKSTDHINYGRLVAVLLAGWFALSLTASALLVFRAGSASAFYPPLPLGLAVMVPVLVFGLWYGASPGFRRFALSLDVRTLTIVQSWRLGGFVFLILHAHGILPGVFALPAGWGDITVGATAWLAATYLTQETGRRKSFIAWQLLGITDLAVAVALGVLSATGPVGILAQGVTSDAMTRLPLSLIPTFAVPLLTILHLISIAQAARWRTQPAGRAAGYTRHAAAM